MIPIHRTIWNPADEGVKGAWGIATASLDWCEANYKYSWYIAEMFNTLSNVGFIALALFGMTMTRQQQLPKRFTICYAGIILIGCGSLIFHMTLLYQFQLLDELPMIYVSTLFTWICFDLSPLGRRTLAAMLLPIGLILFNIAFTYAYLYWPNPVFHQVCYGSLVAVTTFRAIWMLFTQLKGTPINKAARKLQLWGSISFLSAFLIWNLDNLLCVPSTKVKERWGAPFAWILEGHAWWHFGTGLGVYFIITAMALMSLAIRDVPEHYELRWSLGFLPWVARTPKGWQAVGLSPERKPLLGAQ